MTHRILIDARKWNDYGIGTYLKVLLGGLRELQQEDLRFETIHRGASPPTDYPSLRFPARDYGPMEFLGLGLRARKTGCELLHIPHFTLPLFAPPAVLTVHDLIHLRFPQLYGKDPKYPFLKRYLERSLRLARRIIAVSRTTADEILNFMPEVEGKLAVIPEAALPEYYETRPYPRGDYFLFVGNNKPHKNIPVLFSAWERFHRDHPSARLLLVTPGDFRGTGIEVRKGVPASGMPELIGSARALISPSLWEGFDLPALEAVLSGTPVIASDIPVHRELLGDHPLLFPPDRPEALLERLVAAWDDVSAIVDQGPLRARRLAYPPAEMARRTAEAYRECLE